ncbi:hypothetical protein BJ508DRAFT_416951 [Ascobolus immersus RN42]|uniref:Uncharacterized protein n=1 Tax=Ascobolus immersus RN42 TaxID=1160509 RepID=A0A3N4I0H8_ASCIM|nr:hypothetical protein BJ508DRAFT_416951 [Ascobolus immersus RN42]
MLSLVALALTTLRHELLTLPRKNGSNLPGIASQPPTSSATTSAVNPSNPSQRPLIHHSPSAIKRPQKYPTPSPNKPVTPAVLISATSTITNAHFPPLASEPPSGVPPPSTNPNPY